jgi:hypothetical protein
MKPALLAVLWLGVAGCSVDRGVPNARLTCTDDEGCPEGHRCLPVGGRMVCCRDGTCERAAGDGGADDDAAVAEDDGAVTVGGGGSDMDGAGADAESAAVPPDGGGKPAADAARDLAVDQAVPRVACVAGACSGQANCVSGFCEAAPATCAALKTAGPSLADGVYWIQLAGRPRRAYCDMMTGEILCAERGLRNGKIREGSGFKFTMQSELQAGEQLCKIWAVRHSDGYPLDKLFPTTPALPVTTCQALGLKGDDAGLDMVCKYGWDTANGYTSCGFAGASVIKWGNSCDCSLVNGQRPRHYVREVGVDPQGRGLFEGGIPWNAGGTIFGTCRVR